MANNLRLEGVNPDPAQRIRPLILIEDTPILTPSLS